jgi:hypothetical protein
MEVSKPHQEMYKSMFLQKAMKNPVLIIGILLMSIFLMNLFGGKYYDNYKEKLKATSCVAVQVKLNRRIPGTWKTNCKDNVLTVHVPFITKAKKVPMDKLRSGMYRELANSMIAIVKNSPIDNLERTFNIIVHLTHDQLKINALTTGKQIVKLQTITHPKMISEHLKGTVQVQEVTK